MSEPTPPRPLEEIQQDYNATCGKAGDLAYRVFLQQEALEKMQSDLLGLHKYLQKINAEGVESNKLAKAKEEEAAKLAAEAPKVVTPDEVLPPEEGK